MLCILDLISEADFSLLRIAPTAATPPLVPRPFLSPSLHQVDLCPYSFASPLSSSSRLKRLEVLLDLPRLVPLLHIDLQPDLGTLLPDPLIQLHVLPDQAPVALAHTDKGAEVVASVSDVHHLVPALPSTVGGQPRVELVALAHVGQAADVTSVRRLVGRQTAADVQAVRVLGRPVSGVGDDLGEEVGEAVFLGVSGRTKDWVLASGQ